MSELSYLEFLERKRHSVQNSGIEPIFMPNGMFPFQEYVAEHLIRKGRDACFLDTGLGKTLIELVVATNYIRHTNKPVLIMTPLAVATQMLKEAAKFHIDDISYSKDGKIKSKIVIANYERLHYFNPADFECVILDECFAPDTTIRVMRDFRLLNINIKDCLIGDKVLNCTGLDTVTAVKKKKINYAIKLRFNGQSIISSPRHPYFTQRGWVAAKDIRRGDAIISTDKTMRILRSNIYNSQNLSIEDQILRNILLSEMENETTGTFGQSSQPGSRSEKRAVGISVVKNGGRTKKRRADTKSQSNDQSGDQGKGISNLEGYETQTFSAWGKWNWGDVAAAINEGCIVRDMGGGLSYITGQDSKGLPDKLQSRFRELRNENSDRVGWVLSSFEKRSRQKERREIDKFRVESFEILEQGCIELDKYRDESGTLYFYDLEIERHPSFTINSGLVHNSSILKNFEGAIKANITAFVKKVKYRFLFTASPSPNDYIELGTSSEALGYLGYTDMLTKFFTNNEDTISPQNIGTKWLLKGHARKDFFRWVSSWSISARKPSDLGFDDSTHILPELITNYHPIKNESDFIVDGQYHLFNRPAVSHKEIRQEKRSTIEKRCEIAVELASEYDTSVYWCNLNDEGDLLEKLDKNSKQVSGSMSIEEKEEILGSFSSGQIKKLVTKGRITAFGLNWQHCGHTVYFPTFSFETYYQAIRRFWRFGRIDKVIADLVFSDGQQRELDSLIAKAKKADSLFSELNSALHHDFNIRNSEFDKKILQPSFL